MRSYFDKSGRESAEAVRRKFAATAVREPMAIAAETTGFFYIPTTATFFCGSRDGGGVQYETDGWRAVLDEGYDQVSLDSSNPVTINCRHFDGLLIPGRYYNCIPRFGKWMPIDHGQTEFGHCLAIDDITHDTPGTLRVYLRNSGTPGYIDVEAIVPGCGLDDDEGEGEPVVAGSCCTAFWDAEQQAMVVTWSACPPVD